MSIDYTRPAPTAITIRPEPQGGVATVNPGWRTPIQKATLGDDDFSRQLSNTQGGAASGANSQTASTEGVSFWGKDGFGLDDVIDLINPFQHIPLISTIYRELTGDQIAAGPRMIGGGILGGVIGMAAPAADVMFEQQTGKDIGENVVALISGEETTQTNQIKVAQAKHESVSHTLASGRQVQEAAVVTSSQQATELSPAPLSPLDFTQLKTAATLSSVDANAIASGKSDKNQSLLDLFDANRTKAQQDYAKAQSLTYSQAVARDLKL